MDRYLMRPLRRLAAIVAAAFVLLAGILHTTTSAQVVAEPEVDRAGSRAAQGMRHVESEVPFGLFEGNHATGDWLGLRSALADRGITFEGFLIADASQNFRGGLSTNNEAFRHLFEAVSYTHLTLPTNREV